jgi:hypothetical protein
MMVAGIQATARVSARNDAGRWLRLLAPAPHVALVGPADGGRAEVEQHVAARYASMYGARLTHFLPWLLTLKCLGALNGAVGMQPARGGALFLERYLDCPAEQALAARLGHPVARGALVEIGNLVAAKRGASQLLFVLLSATLRAAGYDWIVFTATRALRNNLDKLGFALVELRRVEPGRLDPELLAQWGSYYQSEPTVMAGRLSTALEVIAAQPLLRRGLALYQSQVDALAERLERP